MASGVVVMAVGLPVIRPVAEASRDAGTVRRQNRPLLVAASAGVGLLTGLLANGGGFLLVPMYLPLFGLAMPEAAGTSLLVISVLTLPTMATHWSLRHIDWAVAGAVALGTVPASALGGILAQRAAGDATRKAFGWFLIVSGAAFALYRLAAG